MEHMGIAYWIRWFNLEKWVGKTVIGLTPIYLQQLKNGILFWDVVGKHGLSA